jgi:beta-glucosidase-like glycosyl hydrolase
MTSPARIGPGRVPFVDGLTCWRGHLIPFEAALAAGTAAVMPYYGVPVGHTDEDVAMSFIRQIITGLLRERYKFDGVICTDWGLINDSVMPGGVVWPARAWGVEHLSPVERVLKALDAGVDQFGGESCPELVIELVTTGRLPEARLDASARRLLRLKFELGLFDDPYGSRRGRSALAVAAVACDEAAGLGLGDPMAAAGAVLAALVVDGEEVAHLCLERRWHAFA